MDRGGQCVRWTEAVGCQEGQLEEKGVGRTSSSPRRASTALRFGQMISRDRDVSAFLGASCFLQLCFFLSGPHCSSSSQLLVPSTVDAGRE